MRTDTRMDMNPYKLRAIVDMIRRQGPLPRRNYAEILSPDDLLVRFDLKGKLDAEEESVVKRELALLAEAERFMEFVAYK